MHQKVIYDGSEAKLDISFMKFDEMRSQNKKKIKELIEKSNLNGLIPHINELEEKSF